MIVVVDTVPPTLDARSSSDNVGRVIIEWRARDSQLATDSLTIRHRPAGAGDSASWTDVPAKVTKTANGGQLQDSYAFWPDSNELNLDFEVSIRDQAGTQATKQTSVQRTGTSLSFAMQDIANRRPPPSEPPHL
jgi:hypothetical protein